MKASGALAPRIAAVVLWGATFAAAASAAARELPVYPPPWQLYQPHATAQQNQSPERQAQDWQTCEQWATVQAFVSGVPLHAARLSPDYRQAFSACLSALGYRVGFGPGDR